MEKMKWIKKGISALLALNMVLSYVPVPTHAAQADGLCEHHPVHTAECGYAPAVEGSPCTHTHDDSCGYVEAVEGVSCDCEPAEDGTLTHTDGCGYVEAVAGSPCAHVHDELCGYAEAVEGRPCGYECGECAAAAEAYSDLGIGYICAAGNGDSGLGNWVNGIGWDIAAESNRMTEVAANVYEITYTDLPASDNYKLKFAADGIWDKSWGGTYMGSGVESVAELGGSVISFPVSREGSDVKLKLDLTGYDPDTQTGATFTVTVIPPVCTCEDKCVEGSVNSDCAVCAGDVNDCTGRGYTYDEETVTYTVTTANGLFAVAELINGGAYSANITLAADIVLNENLADKVNVAEDGTVSADASVRTWMPMGENGLGEYSGTFDGGNHTITGLYCVYNGYSNTGLISNLAEGATVKNVKIHDFCLGIYGGAIVGNNRGEVIGCSISGTGILGWDTGNQCVGGVVGVNEGTVEDCTSSAAMTFRGTGYFGGIVGYNIISQATVIGCSNSGTITAAGYSEMKVGGIAGQAEGTVSGCYNTGSIRAAVEDGSVQVGGIVGWMKGTVSGCYNTGTVSGKATAEASEAYVGGIAGYAEGPVSGCYNTGNISGDATGDTTGDDPRAYVGGITSANNGPVSGCYNIGSIDGDTYSGSIAAFAYGTYADCFYLDGSVKSGSTEQSSADGITEKSAAQFASGEVAYLLNGDQSTITFKQTIGTDPAPSFTGGTVYRVGVTCKEGAEAYANTQSDLDHNYTDGICTACGEVCDHSGSTHTAVTDNGDGTHSFTCTVCGDATEEHAFDENGTCVCDINLFSVSGSTLTIDGTLGGKTAATEEDITVLVNKIQDCVDNGITTIIVTGSNPAMIDMGSYSATAIGEAIYCLSGSGAYDENNPYNGKIDLILSDVTEIVEWEFYTAFALNSITLPKVTTIGDQAFQSCYYLKRITFGSVVTSIVQINGKTFVVGNEVGGCDLVLNCGQMKAENYTYRPDLENNVWFKSSWGDTTWKSITLTHSYGDWVSNGDGTHTRTCANDNTHTENGDCSGGEATCTTLAVCENCGASYGALTDHSLAGGKCTECGAVGYIYDAATDTYTVYNAEGLFAVAELVNDGAYSANITLAADIVLNENLADKVTVAEDGTFSADDSVRKWTPIGGAGVAQYKGTFDGGNHTITGLYSVLTGSGYSSLIGFLAEGATVKNVKIHDFRLYGRSGGTVVGFNRGKVSGCSISGSGIFGCVVDILTNAGGIVAFNNGTVENCSSSANLYLKGTGNFGGIVGTANSGSSVTGCYRSGTLEAECVDDLNVGGIVGNASGDITDCHNSGSLKAKHAVSESNVNVYVGGIAGESNGNITCCSNSGSVETVKVFDAVSSEVNAGGIAGILYNGTVFGCYNSGSLSGEGTSLSVGGIAGECSGGAASNCYNSGSVDSGTYSGGITAAASGTFADCYYLDTCVKSGSTVQSSANGITEKTSDQFASGEVAYLLNGDQSTITFKQTLLTDAYPSFTGGTVYQVENCKGEPAYSNTNENIGHNFENSACTACGITCDHSGSTHTAVTDNGDGTHSFTCTVCVAAVTEAHAMDVTTGKCGECGAAMTAIATVTDGTNTCYAADAATLNQAVTKILTDGSRTFTVELPADAEAGMITAIRRAICDTEGVDDGSIHLTLKGVTSIPGTTNWDGVAFGSGDIYDEAGEMIDTKYVTQLASINLPDVTEIGAQAFYLCSNLTSITAPKVQSIGDWGLQGTAITSIDMPLLKEAGYCAFHSTALTEVSLPSLETAGNAAFGLCEQLRTVDLPKLQALSASLFQNCTSLSSVNVPAATGMDTHVFDGCSGLEFIDLPGVTELTYEAFAGCTNLEFITLLSVITEVNANLFAGEDRSSGITLTLICRQGDANTLRATAGTNVEWAGFTWKQVRIVHRYVDGKCAVCGESCPGHTGGYATCTEKAVCTICGASYGYLGHTIDITTGVCTSCGVHASIATVTDDSTTLYASNADTLNQAVTEILQAGSRTFTVELPSDAEAGMITAIRRAICDTWGVADGSIHLTLKGVTTIPDGASDGVAFGSGNIYFEGVLDKEIVTELASVNLPDVTEIGHQAFRECSNLTSVYCPKATVIGVDAFRGCGFSTIVLPEATSIGYYAFADNPNLVSFSAPKATSFGYCPWGAASIETSKLETLELTAAGEFTIGTSMFFADTPCEEINLVLNLDKKDQVTQNDDGTAAWTYTYIGLNGERTETKTFKSITFTCLDGTTNHSYTYTNNGDGTHDKVCSECGYVEVDNEAHTPAENSTYTNNGNGTHSFTCTACGAAVTEAHTGGTATCQTQAVCQHCGESYGELDPNNHEYETNNGICCDTYQSATLNAEGFYEIFNAGQLYWFAQQVIGGGYGLNAKLVNNITLNENLLNDSYALNSGDFRTWTPMGDFYNGYSGIFDGQGYVISGLYIPSTNTIQGMFSVVTGTVKNVILADTYVQGAGQDGGLVGYLRRGTVSNCGFDGVVKSVASGGSAGSYTAGVVAYAYGGTIENCFATGKIHSEGDHANPVFAYADTNGDAPVLTNNYYLENCSTDSTGTVNAVHCNEGVYATTEAQIASVTEEQILSGEVAYLLGGAWGQTIGTDSYPVLGGKKVYEITVCEKTVYSNTDGDVPHNYVNGFCTAIPGEIHYQPAPDSDSDGFFEIGNAGQMFWFANHINTVDRTASAVLTADIDLEGRPWTPIGSTGESSNNFRGTFDGQNHTIKGLYVEGGRAGLGFFGEVRTGTVKNFTIYGEVVANTEVNYVGGVFGSICGLNGENDLERNGAVIQNITSYVNLTAKVHGIGMIGGFVGYANHQSLIENCAWYGTFDAGIYRVDTGAGGFIGKIQENTSEVTIRNCGAYGTIKTNYAKNSYNNTPTIYMGGFLSFSNTNAKTTLENCLFAGRFERGANLTDQAFLGAFGTLRSVNAIKNCYYLGDDGLEAVHSDSNLKPGSDNVEIKSVTGEQLKSGEIAYKLGSAWGQYIGTQNYPVPGGDKVYQVKNCKQEIAYNNNNENLGHNYVNGICTVCGEACEHTGGTATCTTLAVCAICGESYGEVSTNNHDETVPFSDNGFCPNGCYEPAELVGRYFQITNAGQLYWFAAQVNSGYTNINGELKANIVVNEDVHAEMIRINPDPSRFRLWTPIGTGDNGYSGDFCGLEHTVSGLYFNDSTAYFVGLFGYVDSGTVSHVGVIDSYFNGSGGVGSVVGCNYGTVEYAYNTGTVKGGASVGGVVGDNYRTVKYAYNTGTVSGDFVVGGVVGSNEGTVMYAYNTGSVSGGTDVGGVAGENFDTFATVTNCYFDSTVYTGTAIGTDSGTATDVEGKTGEQFASGEVAYLLGYPFGQTIGTHFSPVLYMGDKVYYGYTSCGDVRMVYTNDPKASTEKPEHTGEATYTLTEDGAQHIASYSCCGTTVTEDHTYENGFCPCGLYDLWVAGEQISKSHLTVTGTKGTATYDPATDTLTLNGFDNGEKWYSFTNDGFFFSNAAVYTISDLNIVLEGENRLHADGGNYNAAIQSDETVTIDGDGTLLSGPLYSAKGTIINGGTLDILGVPIAFDGPSTTINGGSVNVSVNQSVTIGTLTVNGGRVVLANESFAIGFGCAILIGEGMAVYDEKGALIENPDFSTLTYALIRVPCDHTQATASYTWTEDPITLTVTVSCTACGETFTGYTTDMDVEISADGFTTTYTASVTLDGKTYTDSKKVTNQVTSVNIAWGSMEFTYTEDETGEGAWGSPDGANRIAVTNTGNTAVTVTAAYTQAEGYEEIEGKFKASGAATHTEPAAAGETAEFYLYLEGEPKKALKNTTVGTVTISIQ